MTLYYIRLCNRQGGTSLQIRRLHKKWTELLKLLSGIAIINFNCHNEVAHLLISMCERLRRAPVAFLRIACLLMSVFCMRTIRGGMAPWTAICLFVVSNVARVVMQPLALQRISSCGLCSRAIRAVRAPDCTIKILF